jgi:small subunit ribosomal protein S8
MTVTLIKILLKIKNAYFFGKESVELNYNSKCITILKLLYQNGFIQSLQIKQAKIIINLRYFENKKIINNIKFFSVPSHHYFISFSELSLINDKKNFILLTTHKGLLTLSQCKQQRLGGKLLFSLS